MNPCLIFVYNADSSFLNQVKDVVHKTVSPKTYQCNLCGLTYGKVSMKKDWQQFIGAFPCKAHFLHRDEFIKQYPEFTLTPYPGIFSTSESEMRQIISADEINKLKSLEQLKKLVKAKISNS